MSRERIEIRRSYFDNQRLYLIVESEDKDTCPSGRGVAKLTPAKAMRIAARLHRWALKAAKK